MEQARWIKLSFAKQLGNIGSELSRARHWETKGDSLNQRQALEHALELMDLTLEDHRWQTSLCRLKEFNRFREIILDWYSDRKNYECPSNFLERYCTDLILNEK